MCAVSTVIRASAPNLFAIGGHNVTIATLAAIFPGLRNNVDRAVLDETGLEGTFDYSLEWTPESNRAATADCNSVDTGTTFMEALKEQLGLKIVRGKGKVDFIFIDHIEHPSAN